jgi:hypothetical protein
MFSQDSRGWPLDESRGAFLLPLDKCREKDYNDAVRTTHKISASLTLVGRTLDHWLPPPGSSREVVLF